MRRQNLRLLGFVCTALLVVALPLTAAEQVGSISVYSARETAGFVLSEDGRSYLDFPGARRYELMEGASEWFPMPVEEVVAAIEGIDFPVRDLNIDIVILHVPRVTMVESSAEGSVVFLTPGRVAYPTEHIHYTVVHEIGHAVHRALMPDSGRRLWLRYARMRGFELNSGGPDVPHARRPHEIFAEDFRALFGGDMARFGGRIENHDLAPPDQVEGLRDFFLSLAGRGASEVSVVVLPNPSVSEVVVRGAAGECPGCLYEVRVFDVRGRLVRDLSPAAGADEITWDGRDAAGNRVAPGAYVITGRLGEAPFSRKIVRILP
jgi:hypothetical protein